VLDSDSEPLALAPLLALARSEPLPPEPWPTRIGQGFARWLPILLMAGLAILTFWLVRQSVPVAAERPDAPIGHSPDYEMRAFSIQQHGAAGAAPSVIEGDQVRHFPDTDTFEMEGVRLRWLDEQGRSTLITARHATMDPARDEVVLREQARLLRPAQPGVDQGLELWGDHLVFDTKAQTLRSDQRVTVRYGPHEFEGGGLRYDHLAGVLDLRGGVHGQIAGGTLRR
jgi:lipopolysaccharide export system protein LptC